MVSFVGMQSNFADALKELTELEYDATEAYETAISKLKNQTYINKLKEFKADHQRHIKELSNLLQKHAEEAPTEPSSKGWLTKGKAILGGLIGDKAILMAIRSNEIDTNTAYDRMFIHKNIWPEAIPIIQRGLEDERRHKSWLEEQFK